MALLGIVLKWTFFFHLGNATLLHNGLLGMPLAPALAGYPFAARPPGTSSKKKLLLKVVEQNPDMTFTILDTTLAAESCCANLSFRHAIENNFVRKHVLLMHNYFVSS